MSDSVYKWCCLAWLLQIIHDAIEQVKGIYVVIADHGNAEDMVKRDKARKAALDKEGKLQILASHTLKPVPMEVHGLANVAATVMNIHGYVVPSEYEPTLIEVVE
ncbi:hypothetical protein F2Q69_00016100 [Brassica cretica]|uniref:Metalloenzyme domain-containing protein n=2 Tax=Brassica TaxID=3705 RepID=A0A0D3BZV1_BRAOL|nr:hypothetical protein F2Q69_00016100 [Brassica cretica]